MSTCAKFLVPTQIQLLYYSICTVSILLHTVYMNRMDFTGM